MFASDISGFRSLTRFRTLGSGTLTFRYRLVHFCSGKMGPAYVPVQLCSRFSVKNPFQFMLTQRVIVCYIVVILLYAEKDSE